MVRVRYRKQSRSQPDELGARYAREEEKRENRRSKDELFSERSDGKVALAGERGEFDHDVAVEGEVGLEGELGVEKGDVEGAEEEQRCEEKRRHNVRGDEAEVCRGRGREGDG